jgi:CMP-N-acetylneuraminic acid synthetase
MKILSIILARKGSKRLPNKNKKQLGGKPLFVWSIDSVKDIEEICDTIVSTDDQSIIKLCKDQKVIIPGIRPHELSDDAASSVDACIHSLNWYEKNISKVDGILLLQPTSPFRKKETIKEGIRIFCKDLDATILSVSKLKHQSKNLFNIKNKERDTYLYPLSSKKEKDIFAANGAIYIISPQKLRNDKSFFSGKLKPIVIKSDVESIDIDTFLDFELAKIALNNKINDK